MKKLLFISAYSAPFVTRDYDILSKEYQVIQGKGSNLKRSVLNYLWLILQIGCQVCRSDIVYCWFADYRARIGVTWARIFGKRSVVIIGGYEVRPLLYLDKTRSEMRSTSHFIFCLKKADLILAVSDHYHDRLAEIYPGFAYKMVRIYIGVDIPDKREIINDKENIIITVCPGNRIDRINIKGLDLFMETAEKLPMYDFFIIGVGGELAHELEKRKKTNNVKLIPSLGEADLIKWYQKAKIYCQFSRFESFGLSLVEAMSWQCIPIVTPIASLIERVGNSGFIMGEVKADEAAQLILAALKSGSGAGMAASDWAKEHYDLKIREKQLLDILKQVMDKK